MKKLLLLFTTIFFISIIFYPAKETISKVNGSPGEKTGSPADGGSCIQCHDDFALNSGVGIPNITSNIPSTGYVPGVTYTITSSIAEAGLVRFGFEVTAEDGLNNKVGTFFITNTTETKFANGTSNTAVTHKQAGTSGINTKSWDCDWEAPVSGTGPVTFYSACNAANDDGDDDDDYIYTTNTAYQESVTNMIIADFTANIVCEGYTTYFTDLSAGGTPPFTYLWDFGDGTTSVSQNPSHVYANCGTYNASLIVTDANGLSDTSINLVVVNCPPVANFTSSNVCEGDCTIFTDYSISGSSPILSWNWNMGGAGAYVGGTTNTSQNPVYCFDNCGTYNVSLDITDANGCVSIISTSIQVFCNPIADFIWSPDTACIGDTVCFTDASVNGGGVINLWYWDFGSISASTLPNPCYIYVNTGIYNVTLSVTDNNGCEDTTTQSIFIDSCNISTGINNLTISNKQLLKVTDILGRETEEKNHLIFYIYDDGTVEKKIILE